MRTIITFLGLFVIMTAATAQSESGVTTKRKAKTEAAAPAVENASKDAPKAGCCAHKAGGKAEASETGGDASHAEHKAAGCCAGKSGTAKASCHEKAEGHGHAHAEEHEHVAPAPEAEPMKKAEPNE